MTQQPFVGRGAIDLSALKRQPPAPSGGAAGGGATGGAGAAGGGTGAAGESAYAVSVTEENFQSVLQASVTAPVVLVFHSPSQAPDSTTMANDVAEIVGQ